MSASVFGRLAHSTSMAMGRPVTFSLAVGVLIVWASSGPMFHFSDTWQLVINTGTTIVTFLMVFLIQNTQNRDSEAIHLKLDELIRSIEAADNQMVDIEALDNDELASIHERYRKVAKEAADELRERSLSASTDMRAIPADPKAAA